MDIGKGARQGALSSFGTNQIDGPCAVKERSFRICRQDIVKNDGPQWTFTGAMSFWRARMKARLRSFTSASRSPSDE